MLELKQRMVEQTGIYLFGQCPKCGSHTYTVRVHIGGRGDVQIERCGSDKLTNWCDWGRLLEGGQ